MLIALLKWHVVGKLQCAKRRMLNCVKPSRAVPLPRLLRLLSPHSSFLGGFVVPNNSFTNGLADVQKGLVVLCGLHVVRFALLADGRDRQVEASTAGRRSEHESQRPQANTPQQPPHRQSK